MATINNIGTGFGSGANTLANGFATALAQQTQTGAGTAANTATSGSGSDALSALYQESMKNYQAIQAVKIQYSDDIEAARTSPVNPS